MDIWYRLKSPAAEYRRYHAAFLWMVDLAKHLVDFLHENERVFLAHFQKTFSQWLQRLYASDKQVCLWMEQYGDLDFRRVVAAQANFLYCQATQVDEKYGEHPLWKEIYPRDLCAVPEQIENRSAAHLFAVSREAGGLISRRKTTVTPYVYECFKHLPWAKFLHCQSPSVVRSRGSAKKLVDIPVESRSAAEVARIRATTGSSPSHAEKHQDKIHVGDIVAVPSDKDGSWKTTDSEYYGYVQSVDSTDGRQALGLLWFYRSGDTTCLNMSYPFSQELFLGDHCNCGDPPIFAEEVIRRPLVAFSNGPDTCGVEFFCRQQYIEADSAWVTLSKPHFRCKCKEGSIPPLYSIGDTLLVASSLRSSGPNLEPVVLHEHNPDGLEGKIRVRKLFRKKRDCGYVDAEPNELVLTEKFDIIPAAYVHRPCQVRFYTEDDRLQQRIPVPYSRQGTADFYFITSQVLQGSEMKVEPLMAPWPLLKQGWDPLATPTRTIMRGLDIFCGGGNFGRGLEEGGGLRFDWAVDFNNEAIHTYKANLKDPNQAHLFRGSVNHYLSLAMEGKGHGFVAQPGQVDLISAGSPCQGFSLANPNRGNDRGLFNESMIASVISFVDFYRPKYALLENVKGMASGGAGGSGNVFAQVTCALVGMGYQVRTFALDAWSFGSPQSRSRIVISITAPGLIPLLEPPQTHSHPDSIIGGSLGKTANGLRTGSRYTTRTPFEYVTAEEATKDLPSGDGRLTCIPFPDHRMSVNLSILNRNRISSIPRFPSGGTFMSAFSRGYMPQPQIDAFLWENDIRSGKDSRSWQRAKRNALMPTVLTQPRPEDGTNGTCLHWDESRLLTIMEIRRAQGVPDSEVIVGVPSEQWKIVGNSVARPMALALGVSLRMAWLANSTTLQNGNPIFPKAVSQSGQYQPVAWLKAVVVDSQAASNGPHAKDIFEKLKTAVPSPKALTSSIPDVLGEPLIANHNKSFAQPENFEIGPEPSHSQKSYGSVLKRETGAPTFLRTESSSATLPTRFVTRETTTSNIKVTRTTTTYQERVDTPPGVFFGRSPLHEVSVAESILEELDPPL